MEVRLFGRSAERLEAITQAGGITVNGEVEAFATLGLITQSLKEAGEGAAVVALCLSTMALPAYASAIPEASTPEQVIWLNPGHSGGALYLAAEWSRSTGTEARKLCQLTTTSYVSRVTGPAADRVFLLPRAAVAALPSRHLDKCHERLDALLPGQFGKAGSILEPPGQHQRNHAPARHGLQRRLDPSHWRRLRFLLRWRPTSRDHGDRCDRR